MPLLVYPLLSLGFQRMPLTSLDSTRQVRGVIAVQSQADFERVQHFLEAGERLIRNRPPQASGPKSRPAPKIPYLPLPEPRIEMNLPSARNWSTMSPPARSIWRCSSNASRPAGRAEPPPRCVVN